MSETPVAPEEVAPEETPAPVVPDPVRPQTTSDLLKIQRALGGDTMWGLRLEIAFKIEGKPDTTSSRIAVTKACVENISCDIDGTVSTEGVTDEQLMNAVKGLEET